MGGEQIKGSCLDKWNDATSGTGLTATGPHGDILIESERGHY